MQPSQEHPRVAIREACPLGRKILWEHSLRVAVLVMLSAATGVAQEPSPPEDWETVHAARRFADEVRGLAGSDTPHKESEQFRSAALESLAEVSAAGREVLPRLVLGGSEVRNLTSSLDVLDPEWRMQPNVQALQTRLREMALQDSRHSAHAGAMLYQLQRGQNQWLGRRMTSQIPLVVVLLVLSVVIIQKVRRDTRPTTMSERSLALGIGVLLVCATAAVWVWHGRLSQDLPSTDQRSSLISASTTVTLAVEGSRQAGWLLAGAAVYCLVIHPLRLVLVPRKAADLRISVSIVLSRILAAAAFTATVLGTIALPLLYFQGFSASWVSELGWRAGPVVLLQALLFVVQWNARSPVVSGVLSAILVCLTGGGLISTIVDGVRVAGQPVPFETGALAALALVISLACNGFSAWLSVPPARPLPA